jgi:hypothetical protein
MKILFKNKLRRIYYLYAKIISYLHVRGVRSNRNRIIEKYFGKHYNDRCFIIGNGPSLNNMDMSLLKNEYTFGVNAIYTNFEKMGFSPTYYVIEDYLVAEDRMDEINSYSKSVKFFGHYLEYVLNYDSSSVPINVNIDYSNYSGFPHFSKSASDQVWVGGTVSYLCMQLAFFMGFKEIYLIGFDHNYTIPGDIEKDSNGLTLRSNSDDPNHFSKDYFGEGKRWHDPNMSRMELAYRKAMEVYSSESRSIQNATVGGKLEIFSRVDYTTLFGDNS